MKFFLQLCFLLTCLFISNGVFAKQWIKTYALEAYVGPEIYYINRLKEGGVKQSGTIYGVRLGYDHISRYKLYWGMDALWAKGILEGKSQENSIKSNFTDMNVEARVGYTFQSKYWRCVSLTPYIGLGYFWEYNFYQHPTPLKVHFKNTFSYIPIGFLSQIFLTPNWSIGLNFKVRYLLEGEQKVTHDPEYNKLIQHYIHKLQYRTEIPLTYFSCWRRHALAISLVPFYEYRSYGHQANFPFDFLETNLNIYGATLKFLYLF